MSSLYPEIDPDGLLEYSVVFTDRSLNHMSAEFQSVMRDISATLKDVFQAEGVAIVPGGGTFGMEAIARQFVQGQRCLVIRNGWFSYRWSQILEMGRLSDEIIVLKAAPLSTDAQAPWAPAPLDQVLDTIRQEKPAVVFAPHVETASGIILPDDYLRAIGQAAREVGALFVLDCIASGAIWVDMKATQVDVLISAPQKGWSASPCSAQVMLSTRALERLDQTTSSSFAADLKKWRQIMQAYEGGGFAYHATMPTDALKHFRDTMLETRDYGFSRLKEAQWQLGTEVRQLFTRYGIQSVAAEGFGAPGVVVNYTHDALIQNGQKLARVGLQIAAGVPLQCDEPSDYRTFRVGLFGLEKLKNISRTVDNLSKAFDQVLKAN
ncbi:MAG: alanine--glyoxylate aminotransferase family protein [Hahellaceae bacterium]|nr:alanine--glyoxylate aminotransferase family protein [Hahellaceae bacterium]